MSSVILLSWAMGMVEILPRRGGEAHEGVSSMVGIVLLPSNHDDYETGSPYVRTVCGEVSLWHGTLAFTKILKETVLHGFWKEEKPSQRLCRIIVLLKDLGTGAKTPLGFFERGSGTGAHSSSPIASGKLVIDLATYVSIIVITLSSLKGFNPFNLLAGIRNGIGIARAGGSSGKWCYQPSW